MSRTFIQEGKTLDFVAPSGGVVSGTALLFGVILAVPMTSAAQGASFAGSIEGVHELPATTSQAWASPGLVVYWDDTNKRLTTTASGNTKVGITAAAKDAAAAVGRVKLTPNA
jgi:predicted RecA/RadA family phage recombinase